MSWLEIIIVVAVLTAGGLYLMLVLSIILTALIERRLVKSLVPAEPDDPEWRLLRAAVPGARPSGHPAAESNPYTGPGTSSYAELQIHAASELGFAAPHLFKPVKGGIYQTHNAMTVSHSGQILAVIRWGTTASIRNEATVLYSALENGQYLVTSDRPTGARTPGLHDDQVYLGADFGELVRRHEERLRASGQIPRPLDRENPLAEHEAIIENRARFLISKGEAYWVDPEQTAFRSTFKGALNYYTRTLSLKHVDRSLSSTVR